MINNITKEQLEVALHYLYSAAPGRIPVILKSLTEEQWITIELVATQLQEERAQVTLH